MFLDLEKHISANHLLKKITCTITSRTNAEVTWFTIDITMCRRSISILKTFPLFAAAILGLAATSCDSGTSAKDAFPIEPGQEGKSVSPVTDDPDRVRVTVKGAVLKPGAYTLDSDSNVAQAILEAGGLTDRAVLDKVNLQGTLKDGMTIVVPAITTPVRAETNFPERSVTLSRTPAPSPTTAATPTPAALMVVVKGAVARPGPYQLPPGSVVANAIVASGGLAANANMDALNLQQPLRAGMTIMVPVKKVVITREMITPAPIPNLPRPPASPRARSSSTVSAGAVTTGTPSPVDINSATLTQLQNLPGVGPSLATRIIAYRKTIGAFRSPEQLMDVKGITPEKFSQIQSLVRVD